MSTTAKELLNIMTLRLKMQEDGMIFPVFAVRAATKKLMTQLKSLPPEEEIDVVVVQATPLQARYVRTKTGQVLGEILGLDT